MEATAQAYIERYGHAPGAHTMRVHSVDDVVAVMTVGDCYRIFASTQALAAPSASFRLKLPDRTSTHLRLQ